MKCPECKSTRVADLDFINPSDKPKEITQSGSISLGEGCIDELNHFDKKCMDCGYSWNEAERKNVDTYVKGFCRKAMIVLNKHDKIIADNLIHAENERFYQYDFKGLGFFSICERDIQQIIVTELCKYYPIWPEYSEGYKNKQRLDIALEFKGKRDDDDDVEPDIAIELKWAGFKKEGQLYTNSLQSLVNDVLKMKRQCIIPNQYFIQFAITDYELDLGNQRTKNKFVKSVNYSFYKNQIKNSKLKLLHYENFNTLGKSQTELLKFNLLLWKIIND